MIVLFLYLICHAPLMTTQEQCQWLIDHKDRLLEKLRQPKDAKSLYVSAILQSNANEWAVWINEQKWTNANSPQGLYTIKSVTPSHIVLAIDGQNITLRANQSYSPHAKAVFDGDMRTPSRSKDQRSGA